MTKTTIHTAEAHTISDADLAQATGGCYGYGYRGHGYGYGHRGYGGDRGYGHGYGGYKPERRNVVNQTADVTVVIEQNA